MPSKQYGVLKKNVGILEHQFLNFQKRIDGAYSRYELSQCRAFIAFSHAEIEFYLEEMSSKVVRKAEGHWTRYKRVTNAIAAMLAFRLNKEISLPDNPTEQNPSNRLDSLIGHAIAAQKSKIMNNHGIKPKNLAELFIAIGMKPDQFDSALIIQLKNFGNRRGDQVHQNSQVSLPNIRDPFDDELSDINILISEIERFDQIASTLR